MYMSGAFNVSQSRLVQRENVNKMSHITDGLFFILFVKAPFKYC